MTNGGRAAGRRPKASLNLARELVQTIYDEGMKPGDRYLSEAEGLRRHKVGRGTYREALRFLELQGVIDMRSGPTGGAEIGQPDWRNLASTVALLMQFADAPLGAILEARIAIEPGMAELAARHATADEIDDMATKLVSVQVDDGHFPTWTVAYNAYWRALAASSHNPLLASLSPALRAIVNSGGFVPNEPYRAEILERLRTVHAAVATHDSTAAGQAMLDLELEFQRRLIEGYPQQLQRVVCWPEITEIVQAMDDER